jgi:diaminopimelate epimerase
MIRLMLKYKNCRSIIQPSLYQTKGIFMTSAKINIIPADPAGNKTIFVTTPVDRSSYQKIASYLLSLEEFEAEQVAFILPDERMEMCGMEFCGNASRTYALIKAKNQGLSGVHEITINVSGCEELLQVRVDTGTNRTGINMPVPHTIISYGNDTLVDLGGIMHLVTTDKSADPNVFQRLKNRIMGEFNPPALGVMFYDEATDSMTPVVYVADVDSTYFEGSCGSGSTAVAAAFSAEEKSGIFQFEINQPAGMIISTIEKAHGAIKNVWIQGPVTLSEVKAVTIDVPEQ